MVNYSNKKSCSPDVIFTEKFGQLHSLLNATHCLYHGPQNFSSSLKMRGVFVCVLEGNFFLFRIAENRFLHHSTNIQYSYISSNMKSRNMNMSRVNLALICSQNFSKFSWELMKHKYWKNAWHLQNFGASAQTEQNSYRRRGELDLPIGTIRITSHSSNIYKKYELGKVDFCHLKRKLKYIQ